MSTQSRPFVSGAFAALSLLLPAVAYASPSFPAALQDAVGLECTPSCTICHEQDPGSSGTASQPFALVMAGSELGDARLVPGDPDTVKTALDALNFDGDDEDSLPDLQIDSDEDGVLDVVEVYEGTDPNQAGADVTCAAEIKNGCGAHIAQRPGPSQWYGPLLLSLLGLMVFGRRRLFAGRR